MKTLAVVAGAIHGLSLSVAYGGPVFARVGLKAALKKIASKDERRAAKQAAWTKFSKVNVPAHVGFTASWLILRSMLRRIHLDRSTQNLLVAKDVLIAGALLTGVAATLNGQAMKRALPKPAEPAKPGEEVKPVSTKEYNKLLRIERRLGRANMAFLAGAIIIAPAIGMGIFRSQRMGLMRRLIKR